VPTWTDRSERRPTCLRSFGGAFSITERLGETLWLSRSPKRDDGGGGDIEVEQLVEDDVGESLPFEAIGEHGTSRGDKRC